MLSVSGQVPVDVKDFQIFAGSRRRVAVRVCYQTVVFKEFAVQNNSAKSLFPNPVSFRTQGFNKLMLARNRHDYPCFEEISPTD
ncbi:unnamed protein product [Calypogeia fissa]